MKSRFIELVDTDSASESVFRLIDEIEHKEQHYVVVQLVNHNVRAEFMLVKNLDSGVTYEYLEDEEVWYELVEIYEERHPEAKMD